MAVTTVYAAGLRGGGRVAMYKLMKTSEGTPKIELAKFQPRVIAISTVKMPGKSTFSKELQFRPKFDRYVEFLRYLLAYLQLAP